MATFRCSVIIPPHRFVTNEKIDATCMYEAFLKISNKYKSINCHGVLYLCEYAGRYHYYDVDGKRVN